MVRFDFRAIFILAVISSGALAAPTPIPRVSAIKLQDLQFSDPAIGGPLAIVNVLEPRGNVVDSSDPCYRNSFVFVQRENTLSGLSLNILMTFTRRRREWRVRGINGWASYIIKEYVCPR
ncbi:hypothetical protein F5880DRAFT_355112 [Lentinula raphanica]|nr:hypothetical protein F5880DRAFT_355112 [Lentinula raphanica]